MGNGLRMDPTRIPQSNHIAQSIGQKDIHYETGMMKLVRWSLKCGFLDLTEPMLVKICNKNHG
jgi:hypothetical protein